MLYTSADEFLAAATAFTMDGVAAGSAVMVALSEDGNAAVAAALGADAAAVTYVDPAEVDSNPARGMAQRVAFAQSVPGAVRLVGQMRAAEGFDHVGAEAVLADALLDGFAGALDGFAGSGRPVSILCGIPLSLGELPGVLECHSGLRYPDGWEPNLAYQPDTAAALFAMPLPEPPAPASVYCSNGRPLSALRDFVAEHAQAASLPAARTDDLVLAAHEIASNSLQHAGAEPIVRIWRDLDAGTVVCEIRDPGVIRDPMTGRLLPDTDREDGRGLWLAHQLCDLTQVRSSVQDGTTVRLHVRPT